MNYYLVKIVYQIICGNGQHTPQFDEQVRVVEAASAAAAYVKAMDIGNREEDCFQNEHQKLVQWKFVGLTEMHRLDNNADGVEIFSKVQEISNEEGYKALLSEKANTLRNEIHAPLTEIF